MINSVLKAIDILHVFSASEPRLSLSQISRQLDIPKSTAHNLLATLVSRGFIERVDTDQYALGTQLVALTQSVRVNVEIRDRAAPVIRELADSCRESVYLTVLDGTHSLYIYAVESPQRLVARTAVGERVQCHCTSVGKATIAFLARSRVDDIIEAVGLDSFTPYTITDSEALYADLDQIRARGYALDHQEHELGTFCVAAPILDNRGIALGALSVSGTDPEILAGRLSRLSTMVVQAGQSISSRLGYVPARPAYISTVAFR